MNDTEKLREAIIKLINKEQDPRALRIIYNALCAIMLDN